MASSTPSAPITSSRGAADTTAGRIYFSTPSLQVRIHVGDLVFHPPPPLPNYSHTILLGLKDYLGHTTWVSGRQVAEKISSSVKIMRQRNKYPGRARVDQKFGKKIRKMSHSAENTLFNIFIHWAELYPIYINWTELYPIFIHWTDLYPILIHWAELYPIFIHWTELYLIFIHWTELYPILIDWAELYPILLHWAELYPILLHWVELYLILKH